MTTITIHHGDQSVEVTGASVYYKIEGDMLRVFTNTPTTDRTLLFLLSSLVKLEIIHEK